MSITSNCKDPQKRHRKNVTFRLVYYICISQKLERLLAPQLSLVANLTCEYTASLHISQKYERLLNCDCLARLLSLQKFGRLISSQLSLLANLTCEYLASLQSLTNSKSCLFLSCLLNIRLIHYPSKLWQVDFFSVVSGGQSNFSLIPQSLCQSKFHQLMAEVSVTSRAFRFNKFYTGHQAAFWTCLVFNHLCNKK